MCVVRVCVFVCVCVCVCDNILIMQYSIILGVLIMLEAAAVIAAIVLQGTIVSVASHHITSHHILGGTCIIHNHNRYRM